MRLPALPTNNLVDHLNSTFFHQLWNAPNNRYRSNLRLRRSTERISKGLVSIGLTVINLPTSNEAYAVYQVGSRMFDQVSDLPNSWTEINEFLSSEQMTLTAYGVSGRTFPSSKIFARLLKDKGQVIIAFPIKYMNKCIGEPYPEMFVTLFKDVNRITPMVNYVYTVGTIISGTTTSQTILNQVASTKNQCPQGTVVIVNGWVYHPDELPTLVSGDVVEIVADLDIVACVDIDVDDNLTGYYSDLYGEYREILHLPKITNPENQILTSDSLTIVVYDSSTKKGVLGHRINPNAVESITHNDFSMSRTALSGFSQSLGAVSIKTRVYVRQSSNPNKLTDDINHINDLYSLSDEDILSQLLGNSTNQIDEWKASNLEESPFLQLFYLFQRKNSNDIISQYVSALGYYEVASVLGQQMRYYTYSGSEVSITKPVRLFGYPCQAIVYSDGLKVPEDFYTITNDKSSSFKLGFGPGSQVTVGSKIAVYVLEEGYRSPVPFTPTQENPSITLDSSDYEIYIVKDYDDPQVGWKESFYRGFKYITKSTSEYIVEENSNSTSTFTFRMKNFNSSFYLIPKYGIITTTYDISTVVDQNNPLNISLTINDTVNDTLPIIGYEAMEVYLNRKRLIEGIDYIVKPIETVDNFIIQNLLVISNCDYLNFETSNNLLEVCFHGDVVTSEDKGYSVEGSLYRSSAPMIYSKSSSRTFVRGVLVENVSENGNIVTVPGDFDNGAPFLIQHNLAYGALKLLYGIDNNFDRNLLFKIDHILGIDLPDPVEILTIDHQHATFSPFLSQIVSDVGNGLLVIKDEPRDEAFLRQFSDYKLLLDRDPLVGPDNDLIDRRFVTLAAHYTNYAVSDPLQMLMVQRLSERVLSPSELSINQVLI